jgi:hypothetical protein
MRVSGQTRDCVPPTMRAMKLLRQAVAVLFLVMSLGAALAQPAPMDDERIFVAVDEAIRSSSSLAGTDIVVRAKEGVITLSGSARSTEESALAGSLARRVRGVTAVNNEIRIANRAWRVET